MGRIGETKKPAPKYQGSMQSPVYRRNLELFRSRGIRCTARFAVAMKNPQHPLGKLFARHDLGQASAIVRALEDKDCNQLECRLQFLFMAERIKEKHALRDLFREQRLLGIGQELIKEPPEAIITGWETTRQKVLEKLSRMSPKGRAQYWAAVRRALFSLRQEQQLAQIKEPSQITSQKIVVSAGPDGGIILDFISSTFSPEQLEKTH